MQAHYMDTANITIVAIRFFYRNDPKFSDRQVWANSADPDQTAPRGAVWSGSTLFAIASASFGCITRKKKPSCSTFRVSKILWFLR